MLLRLEKQKSFLKMFEGRSKLAHVYWGDHHRKVSSHREPRIRQMFRKIQKLFGNLKRFP